MYGITFRLWSRKNGRVEGWKGGRLGVIERISPRLHIRCGRA
jgi:hypothetical protein